MQTSAEVNLKKWNAIVHSKLKTKPAVWTVPEWDAIRKDKYTLKIHRACQGIQKTCTIFINGIEATIEPDTGAGTNIIDENYKHKDWK